MSEILFVDSRVRDVEYLVSRLDPNMRVVVLDADTDGIEQIAAALRGASRLQTIHILSHGSAGALYLGSSILDNANVDAYQTQLGQIGAALDDDGDILLYGCEIAAPAEAEAGQHFIEKIAQYTGADVAASNDLTGLGGDWQLEESTGDIESAAIDGRGYASTLDIITGTSAAETLTGTAGADTINGLEGNDTLDGAVGADSAAYSGAMGGYRFGLNGSNQFTVTDTNNANGIDGTDTLVNIEQASFADGNVDLHVFVETRVHTFSTMVSSHQAPAIAGLSDGGYVMTWQSVQQDGSGNGIYAQRYGANGAAVAGETRINTTTASHQEAPAIASLSDGGYVVVWQSSDQDGSGYGIYAQRYNALSVAVGSETRINTTTASDQDSPAVAVVSDGGYVVTWRSNTQDGNGGGIYSRRYSANGTAVTSETIVNTTTADHQAGPAIAALSDGGYVVTWNSNGQDGSNNGVYAQRYDTNGVAVGGETRVNTFTADHQMDSNIVGLPDGGYVVTWQSLYQDGSFNGIYAQRYDENSVAVGGETRICCE